MLLQHRVLITLAAYFTPYSLLRRIVRFFFFLKSMHRNIKATYKNASFTF
ncbi:hypothetical protein FLAVO9R_30279 [Flavobacterium sp. 9R]|nr:hypothetical protein FLAVO9R_30279 [Flavobacterium sp. 9R]